MVELGKMEPVTLEKLQEQIVLLKNHMELLSQQMSQIQEKLDLFMVTPSNQQVPIQPLPDLFRSRWDVYEKTEYLGVARAIDQEGLELIQHLEQTQFPLKDTQLLNRLRQKITQKTLDSRDRSIIKAILKEHARRFPVTNPLLDEIGNLTPILKNLVQELSLSHSIWFKSEEPHGRCVVFIYSESPHDKQKLVQKLQEKEIKAKQGFLESDKCDWIFTVQRPYDC